MSGVVLIEATNGQLVRYTCCRRCKLDEENPRSLWLRVRRLFWGAVQLFPDTVQLCRSLTKHGLHGVNKLVREGEELIF